MPTYEYECTKCGQTLDAFQKISDKELRTCPKCGKNTLIKLPGGGAGIIFKGSGFYINDYAKSGSRSSSSAPKCNKESKKECTKEAKKEAACDSSKSPCKCDCPKK